MSPSFATTMQLEDLREDLAALRRRIEVIERGFGVPPPREMLVTARLGASILRAKALGLKGGVKQA